VIRVGYFCTAGYTEIGSIQGFLERINPNVRFVRCFPVANKSCLKKGRISSTPVRTQNGISGVQLVNEMKRLIQLNFKTFDLILLIDDMDCRFKRDGAPSFEEWVDNLKQQINEILGNKVDFEALLASPEIEAWFLVDWNNTFAREQEYREIKDYLRYLISKSDIAPFMNDIEEYGGDYLNGSCSIKLSSRIQDIFENNSKKHCFYSKRIHGVGMLARLDPVSVAEKCRRYFAPIYRILSSLR